MENENLDIFNLNIEDFQTEETNKGGGLYKPDPKNGKDSIYRAVVRFLPRIADPKNSAIKKFTYWLEDSEGNGAYYDSPKSISWDEKCPIADLYFKLSKSNSAADQKAAEILNRKEYYFSLVQIVKDPQNPDLEGTIQVYRFPKTIKKVIDAQTSPSKEDIAMGQEPCNVFDLYAGKNFNIKVTIKGGFWNYDECKFQDGTSALQLDGVDIERTPESQKSVIAKLNDAPKLDIYTYRPMTAEQNEKLMSVLANIDTNPGANYSKIAEDSSSTAKIETPTSTEEPSLDKVNEATAKEDDLDEFLKTM